MGVTIMSGPPTNQPPINPYYQPGYPYPAYPGQQVPFPPPSQPPAPQQGYPGQSYNPPANTNTTVYVQEQVVIKPAQQPTLVVREQQPRVGIGAGLAAMAAGVVIGEALADGNHHHHHQQHHHHGHRH